MGRFVYQPVPTDMENYSKHGQVIADIYSGHISTNHNNVIVSATKRIESKIEDVFQIESNIVEQKNVINNLVEDYYSLIDNKYITMIKDFQAVQIDSIIALGLVNHIKNGIGDPDNEELSPILRELVNAIYFIIDQYKSTIAFGDKVINDTNTVCTSKETKLFYGKSISKYIEDVKAEITQQRTDIELVKSNVEAKLKGL